MKWFVGLCGASIVATLVADIWWFDDDTYRVLANVSLVFLALGFGAFTVRYGLWSKWWESEIGPTFLGFKVIMTLVLAQIVAATWWSVDFPFRQQMRFVIYSMGAVACAPFLRKLIGIQRRKPPAADVTTAPD